MMMISEKPRLQTPKRPELLVPSRRLAKPYLHRGLISNMGMFAQSMRNPAIITYTGLYSSSSTFSSYSSSMGIGTASSDRYVVVVTAARQTVDRSLSSVTVANVNATVHTVTVSQGNHIAIAVTDTPITSGTSATITVQWSGTQARCAINSFSLTGVAGPTPAVDYSAYFGNTDPSVVTTPTELNAICAAAYSSASNTTNHDWYGITERYTTTLPSGGNTYSAASDSLVDAEPGGRTVGVTIGNDQDNVFAFARWVPG